MSQALDLTRDLLARRSITPADEGCQELIAARLAQIGFVAEPLPFGKVTNLWARRGRSGPVFCFAGHTDVVPSGPLEEWHSDPFVPAVRDGVLYGRGAADMKSGLAAMLTAAEEFIATHPGHSGSLAFLITSDEEGPSVDGTQRVAEVLRTRGEHIDWCVVGEPSSEVTIGDTIKVGRRGSLSGRLTVHGVQGHVAYPQLADNPIHTLAPALAELVSRKWDEGSAHFQPTTFQVSNLNAGTGAPNVIPGELKARFDLRYTLEWYEAGAPFYTAPGVLTDAVAAAVAEVTGVRPKLSTGGGTSDGRFIAPLGAEVVELGVMSATIHKVNECVRVADIDALHRMYCNLLQRLLAH